MFKQIILALGALVAATAFAAVDINKASQAELESVKGIGPSLSTKIMSERQKAPFKDWNDLTTRVKGVGDSAASKFSQNGLTVNGAPFTGPTAAGAAKAAKAEGIKKKVDAAPAPKK
jgi:competence protein ComEA